jgi:hypothetical protein
VSTMRGPVLGINRGYLTVYGHSVQKFYPPQLCDFEVIQSWNLIRGSYVPHDRRGSLIQARSKSEGGGHPKLRHGRISYSCTARDRLCLFLARFISYMI